MKLTRLFLLIAFSASPMLASAHEHQHATLNVTAPWSREMPPSAPTAAVYFTLHNPTAQADRLLSVDSPAAEKAELHEHLHENGLMKMQQVDSVPVPAHGEVAFAPMGYHVMLVNPKQRLANGEHIPLTLHFEHAGALTIEVPVLRDQPAAAPAAAPHEHSH